MNIKYPNKKKRKGFWKRYEQATIKDFLKVWDVTLKFVKNSNIPFRFSKFGRRPNLSKEEYVCMAVLYAYFNLDFRETEHLIALITGKQLDPSNCRLFLDLGGGRKRTLFCFFF